MKAVFVDCACVFWRTEEKKAEDEEFESDLIAGRLQEDVVRSHFRWFKCETVCRDSMFDLSNVFRLPTAGAERQTAETHR